MDRIKQFSQNEKSHGNSNTRSDNIQSGHWVEFGIERCSMLVIKISKRHLTEGMELPNRLEKRKPINT